jgi:hypothetical protein
LLALGGHVDRAVGQVELVVDEGPVPADKARARAESAHQPARAGVVGEHVRGEPLDPRGNCRVDQTLSQFGADPGPCQASTIVIAMSAAHGSSRSRIQRGDAERTVSDPQRGDQRLMPDVVDVGEVAHLRIAQLTLEREKPLHARPRTQLLELTSQGRPVTPS